MVNVWISPEGEVHSTTLTEVHFDLARKIARKRYGWTPTVALNPLDILFRDGWVRISDGTWKPSQKH